MNANIFPIIRTCTALTYWLFEWLDTPVSNDTDWTAFDTIVVQLVKACKEFKKRNQD